MPILTDCLVVGAGPAGLATSRELSRRDVPHVVLERGDCAGYSWAHFYDSLVLHTGRHMSALPGLGFPAGTRLFPTRRDFVDYLHRYTSTFDLPVRTEANVTRIALEGSRWAVTTAAGDRFDARSVVVATGIVANPQVPRLPDRHLFNGRVRHSIEYRNAAGLPGKRVLVVGAGNSAGEIASEISRAGADVTVSIRTGAHVVPREVLGIPIQYLTLPLSVLPWRSQRSVAIALGRVIAAMKRHPVLPPARPGGCPRVPLIGHHLVDDVRAGAVRVRGDVAAFTTDGVRFADRTDQPFDEVIFATGYRAALAMFGGAVNVDACGFALRRGLVESAELPNLFFVGHNPDIRGGLFMIGRDARRAARLIASRKGRR